MLSRVLPFRGILRVSFALALGLLVLVSPLQVVAQEATPGLVLGQDPDAPCATGRLRVGDLDIVDGTIDQGVQQATEEAKAWQPDTRLYALRLGCPLLTTGYQWEGTFFSESAMAFYATDTGVVEAVNDDPSTIPLLDPQGLDMQLVYRTLVRAGFADDLLLSAAGGVTIRYSTEMHPFGPDSAPREQMYAHVAIEVNGQVTDVWVTMSGGTIYRYGR